MNGRCKARETLLIIGARGSGLATAKRVASDRLADPTLMNESIAPLEVSVVIGVARGIFLKRGTDHVEFVSPLLCPCTYAL